MINVNTKKINAPDGRDLVKSSHADMSKLFFKLKISIISKLLF